MSKETMKLALEGAANYIDALGGDSRKYRQALAEQPAQQDSTCNNALRIQGKAYPRTCKKCGLGPCVELAQQALDKKAENARELGLDYEPAQQEPVAYLVDGDLYYPEEIDWETLQEQGHTVAALYTSPPAQRTWVGLTDEDIDYLCELAYENDEELILTVQAKLKEKNT